MPQVGVDVRFNSLRNCLIAPVTDTFSSLTFGTAVTMGDASELTFDPTIVSEDLRGPRGLLETDEYVDFINWTLKGATLNLNILALALGGSVVDDPGTTNDSKQLYFIRQGLRTGRFAILGQPVTVAGGPADLYVALLKCSVNRFNPGRMGGGWATVEMAGRAMATAKDKIYVGLATLEQVTDMTYAVLSADIDTWVAGQ